MRCAAGVFVLLLFAMACAPVKTEDETVQGENVLPEVSAIFNELDNFRVVLVGERHDRLDHHVIQLEVVKYLYSSSPAIAIGLEFFQQPFQSVLDDYVNGEINEQQMLAKSEYFSRWGYDYRLYAPIMRYARKNQIPLVALNVPAEISRKTARSGLESLDKDEQRFVPEDLDREVPGYRERIKQSFEMHGEAFQGKLDNFVEAQMLWDEGMANRAAMYLRENPARQMIVLAGSGHVGYRDGIPDRLERRIHSPVVTVIPQSEPLADDQMSADYYVLSPKLELPAKGLMGIMLDADEDGVRAQSITQGSAAEAAGVKPQDYIRAINGKPIRSFSDLHLNMWYRVPGETITVALERKKGGQLQPVELVFTLN